MESNAWHLAGVSCSGKADAARLPHVFNSSRFAGRHNCLTLCCCRKVTDDNPGAHSVRAERKEFYEQSCLPCAPPVPLCAGNVVSHAHYSTPRDTAPYPLRAIQHRLKGTAFPSCLSESLPAHRISVQAAAPGNPRGFSWEPGWSLAPATTGSLAWDAVPTAALSLLTQPSCPQMPRKGLSKRNLQRSRSWSPSCISHFPFPVPAPTCIGILSSE